LNAIKPKKRALRWIDKSTITTSFGNYKRYTNMSHVIRTYRKDNKILRIIHDQDAQSPRTDYDNFGTLVCFHSRYELGDKHDFKSPEAFQEYVSDPDNDIAVVLAVYLMDHSGIDNLKEWGEE
jgi:hypothetical protein